MQQQDSHFFPFFFSLRIFSIFFCTHWYLGGKTQQSDFIFKKKNK